MMSLAEKATIVHYHTHRVEQFRAGSAQALGWESRANQALRFAALCPETNLAGKTVLDVGCGYGDLKAYLDGRFHGFRYIGVDLVAQFVHEARYRHGQRPDCYFCISDATNEVLPEVDLVMASGLLCYRCHQADFYPRMIAKLFASAREALAFNVLDAALFPEHPLLVGHTRQQVQAWCSPLPGQVEIVAGYLDNDFTVIVKREPRKAD